MATLYVVSTPIGNLEDITHRAVRVLQEVDLIAAEDTRRTRILLGHFGIQTKMVSFRDATEARRTPDLLARLQAGMSIALVSDAGTPLVADPGFRLVRAAAAADLRVVPVPGASAPLTLLAVAGLPSDRFCFLGFLPAKSQARRRAIEAIGEAEGTQILFESARRLPAALADLAEILGPRPAVIGRELTKKHEEMLRGDLESLAREVAAGAVLRGEIVLAIGPAEETPSSPAVLEEADRRVTRRLADGESLSQAARAVAEELDLPRRVVYQRAHRKS